MIENNKLIVIGVLGLLAYYLYDRNRKLRLVSDLKSGVNNDFVQEVVDDKESICRKEWVQKIGSVSRFSSEEGRKKSENDYVSTCLNK
jgi:hypothetical protein